VADFVGSSNVFPPELTEKLTGRRTHAALRPEAVRLGAEGHPATVRGSSFIGTATKVALDMDGIAMIALLPKGAAVPETGAQVHVSWADEDLHVMGPDA